MGNRTNVYEEYISNTTVPRKIPYTSTVFELLKQIQSIGVDPLLPFDALNSVGNTNFYALVLAFCSFVVSILLCVIEVYKMSIFASVVGAIFLMVLLGNSLRVPALAKGLLIFNLNIAIYLFYMTFGEYSSSYIWFTTATILAFGIYSFEEKKQLVGSVLTSVSLLLLITLTDFKFNFLPPIILSPTNLKLLSGLMLILSSLTEMSVVFLFAHQHFKTVRQFGLASNLMVKNHLDVLNASNIVAHTNTKGVITYVNDKFVDISGFSKNELLGKTHAILNSGHHSKEFFTKLWNTISSGEVWQGEICNRAKNGSYYWVETTIVPIRDSKQNIVEFIALRHDVTERKMAVSSLIQASKLASLGEMAGGIAHEINNPIAIIEGSAVLMGRYLNEPDKLKVKIENINKACLRITKIVSGLEKFSRSGERGPLECHSLTRIATEACALIETKAKRHGVSVSFVASDAANTDVMCNEIEIEQVVINLVNNAIDAAVNFPEKWVKVVVTETESIVSLRVSDSGNGIPNTIKQKLFEPFFTTKPIGQGTGLGLSICKGILTEHNATIILMDQTPNTCFEIQFMKPNKASYDAK